MMRDKKILIKNIYYMLSYVLDFIGEPYYEKILGEKFEGGKDFLAALLLREVTRRLKQGLYREYIRQEKDISVMRGRVNVYRTMQNQSEGKKKLFCEFDELSENNIWNQILKLTLQLLEREHDVAFLRKREIKKILLYFESVDDIARNQILWRQLQFYRTNRQYERMINLCYFILEGFLLNHEKGEYQIEGISVEQMGRLYEKFVLVYYKRHHAYLDDIRARQIRWNLNQEQSMDREILQFLPVMKTDITLQYGEKILIIDTKYYKNNIMNWRGGQKIHSSNLYQIFSYVKNLDVKEQGGVSGLLLYAKTEGKNVPTGQVVIGKNKIGVQTLDLGVEFGQIKQQLDQIVERWLVDEMVLEARTGKIGSFLGDGEGKTQS